MNARYDAERGLGVFAAIVVTAFAAVALLPVGAVFAQSFWVEGRVSFSAYSRVLSEARQWSLLRNTVTIAAGTMVLATLLGAPVGFALEGMRVWGRALLSFLVALPLLIPPYINAVVWADALGRQGLLRFGLNPVLGSEASPLPFYSAAGVIFVLATSYYPIVAFATMLGFRRYDARVEEPGLLVTSRSRVFRSLVLPLVAPALLSGSLLVFVLALVEFSVPSLLQVNVYAVEIYERFSASYDAPEAAAQSLPLLACGVLALGAWAAYVHPRRKRLSGPGKARRPWGRGVGAWAGVAYCVILSTAASVLPLALLVKRSLPLTSYVEVWQTAKEELFTSLIVAALSATALAILAAAMAFLARRERATARLYPLSFLGFLVSGPLLGVGLIIVWNRPGPPALVYDTVLILVMACCGHFLFFAHGGMQAALRDLPKKLDEAAAVSGVSWWRQGLGIFLPLASPALVAVWGLGFLFSFRELDAAVLVAPPGWNTLAVRIFGLMHYGPSRLVAALSVITAGVILAGAAATVLVYARARRWLDARR